ncbi:hypothetical protein Q4E93_21815 [Flavitalea sp. BT771]|uniref:hypothetical protein n=1 Tax=Flavitalea sp. BT771 TaxID=3063329 RepID=UPI0026E159AE|nr:hypothetical protein [Flavitalea sp. BT771]MDO6433263.1 hypothetical protein [Flavitalea sp. BT771]MDV6222832.1 hypothetical protein [Flavitalea sp. BT771]
MKPHIKIYADFNNADSKGRVRLTSDGTFRDLERLNIKLKSGLEILLDDDEGLATSGVVLFSDEEKIWVAKINWDDLK